MFFLDVIAYISLVIIILAITLKCYEYFYVHKMKKTKLKYNYFNESDIEDETISYILYYKRNLKAIPFIIGEIISHSDALCITNKGNIYMISNDSMSKKNAINLYLVEENILKNKFYFRGCSYKLNEIIDVQNEILLSEFVKKLKSNVNKFDYDVTGYNCHMLFLDTLSDFKIKTNKKNICGFLPILNQIVIDLLPII